MDRADVLTPLLPVPPEGTSLPRGGPPPLVRVPGRAEDWPPWVRALTCTYTGPGAWDMPGLLARLWAWEMQP